MSREITSAERHHIRWLVGSDQNKKNEGRQRDKEDDSTDWYRETHNRRLKHQPIIKGGKRDLIIEFLASVFKAARFSYFEYEGDARLALRLMLLNLGHAWQAADDEAWRLTQAALNQIGAVRPPKAEGQLEWTQEEWCGFCRGPLDDESIARRDRYCCSECAKLALTKRSYGKGGYSTDFFGQVAYRQVRREELPEKECKNCGKLFRPNTTTITDSNLRQFCSIQCAGEAKRTLHDRQCENPGCRKTFSPPNADSKYCCRACYAEGRAVILPIRDCAYCGTPFPPKTDQAMYCSPKCTQRTKDARKKAIRDAARQPQACEQCETMFAPKKDGTRFCGDPCRKKADTERAKVTAANPESPIQKLFDDAA